MAISRQGLIDKINVLAQAREQDLANANAKRGAIQILQQVLAEEDAILAMVPESPAVPQTDTIEG